MKWKWKVEIASKCSFCAQAEASRTQPGEERTGQLETRDRIRHHNLKQGYDSGALE